MSEANLASARTGLANLVVQSTICLRILALGKGGLGNQGTALGEPVGATPQTLHIQEKSKSSLKQSLVRELCTLNRERLVSLRCRRDPRGSPLTYDTLEPRMWLWTLSIYLGLVLLAFPIFIFF